MLGINASNTPTDPAAPDLSVVVPIRNESGNIPVLIDRVTRALGDISFEIVFTDDGSTDDSLAVLKQAARANPRVRAISLSRNFGHQVAVTAGLEHSSGRAIVIIDADLQDPPEVIPEMVRKWREGFDVVYGQRAKRDGETWLKRVTAKWFYRLLGTMTQFEIPVDTGDFRLVSRRVARTFLAMPEKHRFVRGMFSWIGFRQTAILYDRHERHSGRTNYTYIKMLRLALDGITSFSNAPLRAASFLGFASASVGFILILWTLYQRFFGNDVLKGWASLAVIVLFLGGMQLLVIGLLGEYIGRMQDETKHRPLYIVQESVNLGPDASA